MIPIAVLGPAPERNLKQAQALHFLGGQALCWKYLRAYYTRHKCSHHSPRGCEVQDNSPDQGKLLKAH